MNNEALFEKREKEKEDQIQAEIRSLMGLEAISLHSNSAVR